MEEDFSPPPLHFPKESVTLFEPVVGPAQILEWQDLEVALPLVLAGENTQLGGLFQVSQQLWQGGQTFCLFSFLPFLAVSI